MRPIAINERRVCAYNPLVVLLIGLLFSISNAPHPQPADARTSVAAPMPTLHAPSCSSPYLITQSFANGAHWQMCWEPRVGYGYRLNQITFTPAGAPSTPHLILNSLHIALMFVPYDDGGPRYRDTSLGETLKTLTAADCPAGTLLAGHLLCLQTRSDPTGRQTFGVFGYFNVANYFYVIQYTFGDDGTISPMLGATGGLQRFTASGNDGDSSAPGTTGWRLHGLFASNHNHLAFWRMDFDLDGPANDVVEQIDVAQLGATRHLTKTALLQEAKTQNDLARQRFWRVRDSQSINADGHSISYEIEPSLTHDFRASEGFTQNDFYVTQNNPDEVLVGDGADLDSYVNGESISDAVLWYGVNFHHVPRAEDDAHMPVHWQGFSMRPRDLRADEVVRNFYLPLIMKAALTQRLPAPLARADRVTAAQLDPLNAYEVALAERIAWASPAVRHRPRATLLHIQRHDAPKLAAAARQADVFLYDYASDQVLQLVIDLPARTVAHIRQPKLRHLPATQAEARAAAHLLRAHTHTRQQVLVDEAQPAPQATLYFANEQVLPQCRMHRCVQVFLGANADTGDRYILDTSAWVIDLSAKQVLALPQPVAGVRHTNAHTHAHAHNEHAVENRAGSPSTAAPAQSTCNDEAAIDVTLAIGSRWEMCWAQRADIGLQLQHIVFTPRLGAFSVGTRTLVLTAANVAQIYATNANASSPAFALTDGNGLVLRRLTQSECVGGTLRKNPSGQSVLCQMVRPRGYAWRGPGGDADQVQGESLIVFAVSEVSASGETYTLRWQFDDDGSIYPALGVGGPLSAHRFLNASLDTGWPLGVGNTRLATSRSYTAYWRLDFDLGGSANDELQQFDYADGLVPDTRLQTTTTFGTEVGVVVSPNTQRFWRVVDRVLTNSYGQPISYEVLPLGAALFRDATATTWAEARADLQADVYWTEHKDCEQLALRNPSTSATGCATQLSTFANGETVTNGVVWVAVSWHHVPRDEDEPTLQTHWQNLLLAPRDFLNTSPVP